MLIDERASIFSALSQTVNISKAALSNIVTNGDEFGGQYTVHKSDDSPKKKRTAQQMRSAGHGGKAGSPAMLQFGGGGDVANELDLLDFIDDEEEKTQMKIRYVLQHVVPLIKFPDGMDEKNTLSSSSSCRTPDMDKDDSKEHFSTCAENNFSALSEQNLSRHNIAGCCGNMEKNTFK